VLTAAGAPAAVRAAAPAAATWLGGARGAGGPAVSRQAGQELARHELSKLIYHPATPLVARIIAAMARFLGRVGAATPGGWWTLVALGALLVIAASGVLAYLGPVKRSGRRARGPLLTGTQLTARDYRERAQRQADAGQFAAAIIDCLRAIAAELDERNVLARLPGRTASELARDAGRVLPALQAELTSAARLFEDVRYGGLPGTLAGYQQLRDLDVSIRAASPRPPAAPVLTAQAVP
jgi:hypothetical protein